MPLFYEDDGEYAVEMYDEVEVLVDGATHSGEIIRIWPSTGEVKVYYEDGYDIARTTGRARRKTARVSVSAVTLISRSA